MIIEGEVINKHDDRIAFEDSLKDKIERLTQLRKIGAVKKPTGFFVKRCPHCGSRLSKPISFFREESYSHVSYSYRACPRCEFEWGSVNGW